MTQVYIKELSYVCCKQEKKIGILNSRLLTHNQITNQTFLRKKKNKINKIRTENIVMK